MAYVFDPAAPVDEEVRRIARERIDDAVGRLDAILAGTDAGVDVDIATSIHQTRKRCKELRGLARLVRPAIRAEFRTFDTTVRDAARELSSMRDAHALLGTIEHLLDAQPGADDALRAVRDDQSTRADAATASAEAQGAERVRRARELLAEARVVSQRWQVDSDDLVAGLRTTYGRGRKDLSRCTDEPNDHRFHEWRKSVKYLWYQLRLLREASPSVLAPAIAQLDSLADALGDDHDLAVLVELLDAEPDRVGDAAAEHVKELARAQQTDLRHRAVRIGVVVYAERPQALARRVGAYRELSATRGPERPVGSIAALSAEAATSEATDPPNDGTPVSVERERAFLVDSLPDDLADATPLRQGYLAIADNASVRVRDAGGDHTLTFKAGHGAERVELEWPITREAFEATWPATEGRRVVKTRARLELGAHVVEVDVFADALDGLVLAEVEFDSMEALTAFEPPGWFGREVTDDGRYTNAALARDGLPTE